LTDFDTSDTIATSTIINLLRGTPAMPTIKVFEPPLCCNTGVCGTDVDQKLVDFTADVHWAQAQGATVVRANLAQDPTAFAQNLIATNFLQVVGAEGLPLVLVDDVTVMTGHYPSREEIAKFSGVATATATRTALPVVSQGGCCGGTTSSCC
jgi:hypothetical protein